MVGNGKARIDENWRLSREKNEYARRLLESGRHVQFLGVTATLIAYLAFLFGRWDYFASMESKLVPALKFGWPIIVAYAAFGTSMFVSGQFWTPQRALLWIYVVFISSDVVLLGVLVWLTGGPGRSIFAPLFLLIPTVAACYCHYKSKFFWFVIVGVVATLAAVSFLEFEGRTPSYTKEGSNFSTGGEALLARKGDAAIARPREVLLTNVFTIGCIFTAAYCYAETHRIRSEYCDCQRSLGDTDALICKELYLV